MERPHKKAPGDRLDVAEMAHVRCQCLCLRCGAVRIGSLVCERLMEYLEASGILDLRSSYVNRKDVTATRGSNQYNAQEEKG